ncbi:unnamed protein product [Onchocerca flexuosa]|uniref:Ovule protein n=1 Tax=Onchocerca flexuosa TaxID=387005 RepID=A0A183HH36_9BILA|nr:unnamed protein product [Onchocerca flexuosa]
MKKERNQQLLLKLTSNIVHLRGSNSLLISHSSLQLFTIRRLFYSQDNLPIDPSHNFLCHFIHVVD